MRPVEVSEVAFIEESTTRESTSLAPRHGRRLSDKILVAFHNACDINDFEIAEALLRLLEIMLTRRPTPADLGRRRMVARQQRHDDARGVEEERLRVERAQLLVARDAARRLRQPVQGCRTAEGADDGDGRGHGAAHGYELGCLAHDAVPELLGVKAFEWFST